DGPVPLDVQALTGIADGMLADAAPIESVLPSFLEFSNGCVFVAHNARFDYAFLREACRLLDYEPPHFEVVDTYRLSRRLFRGEVTDRRLATLAAHVRSGVAPNHRAFPDAAACMDVLYALIERAADYGITTLGELHDLQRSPASPWFDKARLARGLPRTRG